MIFFRKYLILIHGKLNCLRSQYYTVFNEKNTILKIIQKIESLKDIDKEIIIVDDCSDDGTKEILTGISNSKYKIIFHEKNLGKGAAIKTAKKYITGQIVIIQDADLEYNPKDYRKLIKPS